MSPLDDRRWSLPSDRSPLYHKNLCRAGQSTAQRCRGLRVQSKSGTRIIRDTHSRCRPEENDNGFQGRGCCHRLHKRSQGDRNASDILARSFADSRFRAPARTPERRQPKYMMQRMPIVSPSGVRARKRLSPRAAIYITQVNVGFLRPSVYECHCVYF